MKTEKLIDNSDAIMPIIAALPYAVKFDSSDSSNNFEYDPLLQKTIYAMGGRDYSTCREDESVWNFPWRTKDSKSDTKKDD